MRNVMKRAAVILAGSALVAATPAQAEDAFSGFYVGFQGGHQWTDTKLSDQQLGADANDGIGDFAPFGAPFDADLNLNSFIGGAHLGYNHRMGSFVIGVEADFEIAGGSDSDTFAEVDLVDETTDFSNTDVDEHFQASLRARLGWATGRTLIYATGGLAFAQFNYAVNQIERDDEDDVQVVELDDAFSDLAVGFTVGAGVEYLITDSISFGAEYRYTNYGAVTETITNVLGFDDGQGGLDFVAFQRNPEFDHESHAIRARLTFHFN